MSLDLAELDHTCNVIRRQVEEEFKNLTVIFIVHRSGEREKTVLSKKNQILSKPYGRKTYDMLGMTKNIHQDKTEFMGLVVNQKNFLNIFKSRHFTAVFFINADEFAIDSNAKQHLYHLAWHALNSYTETIADIEKNKKQKKSFIIKDDKNTLQRSFNNLMADVFGGVMMEIQGHEGFIQELASKRNLAALSAIKNFEAEFHPYSVAYDACQFVYDDLKDNLDPKSKVINSIMDLSTEVASTYGKDAIKEWWIFSRPAQEMAWIGHSPEEILATAIFTSENTHVRAFAYMIAESLDIETNTDIKNIIYNPYVDDEINERNHIRIAESRFQKLLKNLKETPEKSLILTEAKFQTEKLLMGIPAGWTAAPLIQACNKINFSDDNALENFQSAYYEAITKSEWTQIKSLASIAIKMKKAGHQPNEVALIKILSGKEGFNDVVSALNQIKDIQSLTKDDNDDTGVGMKQFLYDSYEEMTETLKPLNNEKAE